MERRIRVRTEVSSGGDEPGHDVCHDVCYSTGYESVGLVAQPSCGELRGHGRSQPYVEQQQRHVQYE